MTLPKKYPQKYPIGIQTFSKLIEEGYAYVDKTAYIAKLIENEGYYFLSRPRRFGKSLLLSTLRAFFEGRRELFKGLAIDRMPEIEWTISPVIHIDLNNGLYDRAEGLSERLNAILENYEKRYGIISAGRHRYQLPIRFENLIRTIYSQSGQKVVILIDEYDKPLLGLEEESELYISHQSLLKAFFGNLKSLDKYIRLSFLTGVARFNKVSIFSDLNNLNDISMDNGYADICGLTEQELLSTFRSDIENLAEELGQGFESAAEALRIYYDGYLFAPKGNRLYNPFSVMRALQSRQIKPYWFETGTPTFLARKVKSGGINPALLNGTQCRERDLIAVYPGSSNPVPLMFQTGYLTIGSYDSVRARYTLRFPNREVEIGFAEYLLPLYAPKTEIAESPFSFYAFQDDLYEGRPEDFMRRLATMLKDLPGEDHTESVYRAVTYLICTLCSTFPQAERHSYKGRSDLEVETPDYVYLMEFKYNGSVSGALEQIENRDYAGRYGMESRKVYLIGANYSETKSDRGLTYKVVALS